MNCTVRTFRDGSGLKVNLASESTSSPPPGEQLDLFNLNDRVSYDYVS